MDAICVNNISEFYQRTPPVDKHLLWWDTGLIQKKSVAMPHTNV